MVSIMNDEHKKDELRFDKLYRLLGEEVNNIYDDNIAKENNNDDNTSITNNNNFIEKSNENINEPIFNDVFNIFNNQPNSVENVNTINNNNNKEYIEELNQLVNNYNINASNQKKQPIVNDIFSDESNIFNNDKENNTNEITIHDVKEDISKEIYIEPTQIEINNNNKKIQYNKNEFRNKTIINNNNIFDDIDDVVYQKKSIIDYLTNKKILTALVIITFFVVCILVIKVFRFGALVDIYNEYVTETEKESDNNTKVYGDEQIDSETLKKSAATELIDCINAKIDTNNLPDNITTIVKEINDYYKSSNKYFSFAYKDIFTGFTVSYNENGNIFAASTIKAPVNIYLYEMAKDGKINLDEELTYTSNYYNNGTGVLKNKPVNTKYSIRTLSEYAIRNSDNAAHNMLMDHYGRNNIKDFWKNLGTNTILTGNDNWGLINAHDAMIYMKELYAFYINDNEYGTELMNNFLNAKTKFITGKNDYKVANKSGWSGNSQHDVSIVFAENPYIIIAMTNLGYDNNYMNHFNRVNDLAYKLHNEYWKYKMSMCNNIKQYD